MVRQKYLLAAFVAVLLVVFFELAAGVMDLLRSDGKSDYQEFDWRDPR